MEKLKTRKFVYILSATAVLVVAIAVYAQQKTNSNEACPMMSKMADKDKPHEDCPMMKKNESMNQSSNPEHLAMVMKNGETEMGFSQTKTAHHFLIMKDGGAIQIETNAAGDTENRDKIRKHLAEIAGQFKNGIFTTPFAIHGQIPPGVPEMDKLKSEIQYTYEETEKGAQVRISTNNPQALTAIHNFLKFQIVEHQTGDPTEVKD
jgi:hypothetical protein